MSVYFIFNSRNLRVLNVRQMAALRVSNFVMCFGYCLTLNFLLREMNCNVDVYDRSDIAFELVPQVVGCEMITKQTRTINLCKVIIQRGVVCRTP